MSASTTKARYTVTTQKPTRRVPDSRIEKFIELLRTTGNVTTSALGAGVSRAAVYNLIERDEAFRQRVDEAKDESVEHLEAIARQRAEKSSDLLLIFLLRALRPEKYREKYQATLSTGPTDYVIDIGALDEPKAQ